MSEMVEQVARGMFARSPRHGKQDPDEVITSYRSNGKETEPAWKLYEYAAYSALEAILELRAGGCRFTDDVFAAIEGELAEHDAAGRTGNF